MRIALKVVIRMITETTTKWTLISSLKAQLCQQETHLHEATDVDWVAWKHSAASKWYDEWCETEDYWNLFCTEIFSLFTIYDDQRSAWVSKFSSKIIRKFIRSRLWVELKVRVSLINPNSSKFRQYGHRWWRNRSGAIVLDRIEGRQEAIRSEEGENWLNR